jgi:hypothetical protein
MEISKIRFFALVLAIASLLGCNGTNYVEGGDAGNNGDGPQPVPMYVDNDHDYVGGGNPVTQCPSGVMCVVMGGDCDDTNSRRFPGATELCDGIDNNCNNTIDEGCGNPDPCANVHCSNGQTCTNGVCSGCVAGTETCNGADDDCDGQVDEGGVCPNNSCMNVHCGSNQTCMNGMCVCAPSNGGVESCDGIDNNCNGQVDESGCSGGMDTYEVTGRLTAGDSTHAIRIHEFANRLPGTSDGHRECAMSIYQPGAPNPLVEYTCTFTLPAGATDAWNTFFEDNVVGGVTQGRWAYAIYAAGESCRALHSNVMTVRRNGTVVPHRMVDNPVGGCNITTH